MNMRKRPINLSLDAALLEKARDYRVNVSAVAEEALKRQIADEEAQRWLDENREAIVAQNRFTAEHGLFGEESRNW